MLSRLVRGIGLLLGGLVVLGLLSTAPSRRPRFCAWWCRRLLSTIGLDLELHGTPRPLTGDRGVLVVANHISWLDPVVLTAVQPVRMLAKSEVEHWPVIGWLGQRARTLWIERRSLRALRRTCTQISGALAAAETVAVFPEGTTTCGRRLGPFHPALFQAAIDADAVIQPVALRYAEPDRSASPATACVGGVSLIRSVLATVGRPRLTVEVHLLEPVLAVGPGRLRRQRLARSVRAQLKQVVLEAEREHCTDTVSGSLAG